MSRLLPFSSSFKRPLWLSLLVISLLAILLVGCTREVVKEVPREVVVEKEVVEIQEVPVEVVVEREVVKEIPVQMVVEKEVVREVPREVVVERETDPGELVIYSGRSESLVDNIIRQFAEATGIEVEVRYANTGQLAATLLEEGRKFARRRLLCPGPGWPGSGRVHAVPPLPGNSRPGTGLGPIVPGKMGGHIRPGAGRGL